MTFVPYRKRYKDFLRLDPATGCLEWTGYIDKAGYGRVRYDGESGYVHRYAWEQEVGPITEGLLLRHSCDNPKCANVTHLSEGTHEDNAADRDSRGRSGTTTHGRYVGASKKKKESGIRRKPLPSCSTILAIRADFELGERIASLTKKYDLSQSAVGRIVRRETYKSI